MTIQMLGIGMMFIYNCLFFNYCSKILKTRIPKILLLTLVPAAAVFISTALLEFSIFIPIVYMVNLLMYFIVMRAVFRGKSSHIFWAAENVILHILVIRALTVGIISLVMKINMFRIIENTELYFISLTISLVILTIFLFTFSMKIDITKIKQLLNNPGQLRFVYTAESVLLAFLFFSTYAYYYNLDLVWFTIFHMLTSIFALICFYVIFNMSLKTSVWIDEELNGHLVDKRIEKQLRRYREYHSMAKSLNLQVDNYSSIPLVDCILRELAEDCNEDNIKLTAQCNFKDVSALTELQLCKIFSLLCTNALEACQRQVNGDRWIHVDGSIKDGVFNFLIKNSFDGVVEIVEKELVTVKKYKDFQGMGIKGVKRLVEEAGGSCEIKITKKDLEFSFLIKLPIKRDIGGE